MRPMISTVSALAIALSMGASTVTTAQAAPLTPLPTTVAESSGVVNVQHRRGYHRRNGRAYYNGHRGYRHPRRGWRQHNGWWFPPAAFAGALIGGAIALALVAWLLLGGHFWLFRRNPLAMF